MGTYWIITFAIWNMQYLDLILDMLYVFQLVCTILSRTSFSWKGTIQWEALQGKFNQDEGIFWFESTGNSR
jgi:hypothetical protein